MHFVSVGRRLVAAFVDGAIVFLGLGFGIAALTVKISSGPDGVSFNLGTGPTLALVALWFAYYIAMEAMFGATIGKLLLGVRVLGADGNHIGWKASLIRNLLRAVDMGFCFVGAILIWTSARRQRLGDLAANTVVVLPS